VSSLFSLTGERTWPEELTKSSFRVARPAVTVLACTLLVKLIATGKEFVVAGAFGRSDALDAFLAAFLVPGLLINLTAESMSQALIPELARVRVQQGIEKARELLAASLARLCFMLVAVCTASGLLAPYWIRLVGWNFPLAKLAQTLQLFYGLVPFVVFGAVASVCGAVLNSEHRVAAPAIANGIIPVFTGLAAFFFAGRLGPWALVWSSVSGAALYALWMTSAMARAGYPFHLHWRGGSDSGGRVRRQQWMVLTSSLVASGGLLADQAMAASLAPGSVSSLAFASRFVSVVLTLAAGVASAVIGPHMADLAGHRDWSGCRLALRRWSRLAWISSSAGAVPLIFGAQAFVRMCFQHGAFHTGDTAAVAHVLVFSALQIPFFCASRVHYRFLLAMQRADLIVLCGTVNLVLDIVLNLCLMRILGVAGIALATSLWTVSTCFFFAICTRRVLAKAESGGGEQ
jgi:putative peptidoglycan lipid II flippase